MLRFSCLAARCPARWRSSALKEAVRCYTDTPVSQMRNALSASAQHLVGVGQLAARMPHAYFPLPKPFGVHVARGVESGEMHELFKGCSNDARSDLIRPGDDTRAHCSYAVRNEFPWFPLFVGMSRAPEVKEAVAEAILETLQESPTFSRRWWFTYELFFERLPRPDIGDDVAVVPFLQPERFFCTSGKMSARHRVLDNLLGGKDFCPFVEKFAGAEEATKQFTAELMDVLSPICMMTVKDFLKDAGMGHGDVVDEKKLESLTKRLSDGGFAMTEAERAELRAQLGARSDSAAQTMTAARLVDIAGWLRGDSQLAVRLREHLLGVTPVDLQWHAPGEVFLDRLSRVISSVETRASQLIEGELPPEKKERFFVDAISKPWHRSDVVIDRGLIHRLQQGLLSTKRFSEVCDTQVEGEPRRKTQNWISSEKHDDMVGKEKVLHYLPPPPDVLPALYDGYFECVRRMLEDPQMDPIVCATIAKIALNTLHPMADGNGRVQRMLFQLILFKFNFLPRVNVPVSVVMLQDRTGYEVMQQGHVDPLMAGLAHHCVRLEGESEDSFQHVDVDDGVLAIYRYQDFTFAVSCMTKLMQNTLPVLAAKAYFLRRFDWRVDELLKDDALLPPKAATKIAKTFKNDASHGLSYLKVLKLVFMDGWWIGVHRIGHFLRTASHPDDLLGVRRLRVKLEQGLQKSHRRRFLMSSGQQAQQDKLLDSARGGNSTGRVRWVAASLDKFHTTETALKRALDCSFAGDTVLAVHYPMMMNELVTEGIFPECRSDMLSQISDLRKELLAKVQGIADSNKKEGVEFIALVGDAGADAYKPARALCRDLKVAEVKPFRIYVGYDKSEHFHKFTDYVVQNAPCDVAIIKQEGSKPMTRWVGISGRNLQVSAAALKQAFVHSRPGDTVVAVHYPVNPFLEIGSSVYEAHFSSVCDDNMDVIMDSTLTRVSESIDRLAKAHCKEGVSFKFFIGPETAEPHKQLVGDAMVGASDPDIPQPSTVYVGYSQRRDRTNLVDPHKLYDVAEYIVRNSPCNVIVVKDRGDDESK